MATHHIALLQIIPCHNTNFIGFQSIPFDPISLCVDSMLNRKYLGVNHEMGSKYKLVCEEGKTKFSAH